VIESVAVAVVGRHRKFDSFLAAGTSMAPYNDFGGDVAVTLTYK
jgi:hypothetical protein